MNRLGFWIARAPGDEGRQVRPHGFDLFASLSGRRAAKDVPHDSTADRTWVEGLIARDGRFAP